MTPASLSATDGTRLMSLRETPGSRPNHLAGCEDRSHDGGIARTEQRGRAEKERGWNRSVNDQGLVQRSDRLLDSGRRRDQGRRLDLVPRSCEASAAGSGRGEGSRSA